jgi:hypothetical protein
MIGNKSSLLGSERVTADPPYNASERVTLFLLGALAIWFAIRGMSTGEIGLKLATFRRSDNELLFWFGIGMNLFMGANMLAWSFGMNLFK